jgi:MFS superfamily sulfate permease-like transporter
MIARMRYNVPYKITTHGNAPKPFRGPSAFNHSVAVRDVLAGVSRASMNIPQVLGYTRIAGTPVVTGLYTVHHSV